MIYYVCALLMLRYICNPAEPTSNCLALKKVAGPVGGPSSGGTTTLRLPPGRIVLIPSSKLAKKFFGSFSIDR